MSLPLARELGPYGIRVVAIAPATFRTPLVEKHHDEENLKQFSKEFCLNRIGNPEEFGEFVAFVCCSSFLTGCVVGLDGGLKCPNMMIPDFVNPKF